MALYQIPGFEPRNEKGYNKTGEKENTGEED